MEDKDFYGILGITDEEKNLPWDEFQKILKKKFKKLGVQYHPDKAKDDIERAEFDEKFKEISEAYNTLNDKQKKEEYDMKKMYGGDFSSFMHNEDMDFDAFNPFHRRKRVVKGEDSVAEVYVTLEEIYNNSSKTIQIQKVKKCTHCNGTGAKDGKVTTCPHCNGTGRLRQIQRTAFGTMIQETMCPHCGGTGKTISENCPHCNGTGKDIVTEDFKLEVPRATFDGGRIRFDGCGSEPLEGEGINGDLYVIFRILPNDKWKVEDRDLVFNVNVSLGESLIGTTKTIECIDGTTKDIIIHPCTKNGKRYRMFGKGLYDQRLGTNGHMYIEVNVQMPKELTEEQIELIKKFEEIENNKK